MMTRRRLGYALIELMVVMTVTAIILTLSAGMIHLLLKLERSSRTASEQANDLARLGRDFRADVHASIEDYTTLEAVPKRFGANRMRLKVSENRTVEYQVRPGDILRTVREGDKVRHFETYRRPSRTSARFWSDGVGPRTFVLLMIDQPTDSRDNSLYRKYQIEAELGKDHRLNPRAE
jgi:prepilin-type N-terminal cleavage/methylation domain-containing protein